MHITDISAQLKSIMPAAGLGFILGAVYLLIRIVRSVLSDNRVVVFVTDVAFIVSCTLSSYMLLIAVNNGHPSFYLILAEITGYCAFTLAFGQMIFEFFQRVFSVFKRIFAPLLKPFIFLKSKINETIKKYSQNSENIKNKLKKLLKRRNKVVYNNKD